MSCYHPNYMLDLGFKTNGKRNLKMLPHRPDFNLSTYQLRYGKENIISVPCGQCLGCRLDHAKEWAFRCVVEAKQYGDNNCFLTLTYDDDNLFVKVSEESDAVRVINAKDAKKDVDKFFRRLRDDGIKFRYFGCIEYGETTHRIHSHIIMFNFFPNDVKVWDSKRSLFTSKYLDSVWKKGRVVLGMVSYQSAGYVARYTLKKTKFDDVSDEMIFMSRHPGIGEAYIRDHAVSYFDNDFFIQFVGSSNPIIGHFRYADKVLDNMWFDIENLKIKRSLNADLFDSSIKISNCCKDIEKINSDNELKKYKQISKLRRSL